ncbi:MAG: hypothetical protein JNL10_09160 [Verrucomicrobiales bacterium]|nr:hypothetical protein [Verrucomicrobiales bacterium]
MRTRESLQGLPRRQLRRICTLDAVASWENLFLAADRARRGKRRRADVEDWWRRRETELALLREELLGGFWLPGPYRIFTIHEPNRQPAAH